MEKVKYAVTELKVVYTPKRKVRDRPKISSSSDAFQYIVEGFDPNTIYIQEEFAVMYLSRSNEVVGLYRLSKGGMTSVVADIRLVLAVALRIGAVSCILAHNHPSGNLSPSQADKDLTYKIKEGAKFLDLKILDHLIVSPCGKKYFSFADDGLI